MNEIKRLENRLSDIRKIQEEAIFLFAKLPNSDLARNTIDNLVNMSKVEEERILARIETVRNREEAKKKKKK